MTISSTWKFEAKSSVDMVRGVKKMYLALPTPLYLFLFFNSVDMEMIFFNPFIFIFVLGNQEK